MKYFTQFNEMRFTKEYVGTFSGSSTQINGFE